MASEKFDVEKFSKKTLKNSSFILKKLLKRVTLKAEKIFIASRNCEVTPYQILEEFPWPLRLEKPKSDKFKRQNC